MLGEAAGVLLQVMDWAIFVARFQLKHCLTNVFNNVSNNVFSIVFLACPGKALGTLRSPGSTLGSGSGQESITFRCRRDSRDIRNSWAIHGTMRRAKCRSARLQTSFRSWQVWPSSQFWWNVWWLNASRSSRPLEDSKGMGSAGVTYWNEMLRYMWQFPQRWRMGR